MGLDSVELIIAFEKYFQIDIPDREAEKIGTVGQAAACITRLKSVSPNPTRTAVYYTVLQKLLDCLQGAHHPTMESSLLATIWPTGVADKAASVAACLALEVPPLPKSIALVQPERLTWLQRLFGSGYQAPHPPDWAACTVADLTDWIVAQNYATLLPTPATLYEVQRAAIGITSYCSGVSVPEIQLTDSFTNDLGMD